MPFEFGQPINALDMATVNCAVVKGDTPIDIYWTHNKARIEAASGTSENSIMILRNGQRMSTLSIESVRAGHAGQYTCVATNTAGTVRHTVQLTVNGLFVFSADILTRISFSSLYSIRPRTLHDAARSFAANFAILFWRRTLEFGRCGRRSMYDT